MKQARARDAAATWTPIRRPDAVRSREERTQVCNLGDVASLLHGEEYVGALQVAVPHVQAVHVLHSRQQLVHEAADLTG